MIRCSLCAMMVVASKNHCHGIEWDIFYSVDRSANNEFSLVLPGLECFFLYSGSLLLAETAVHTLHIPVCFMDRIVAVPNYRQGAYQCW